MQSPLFRHPIWYDTIMKVLYQGHLIDRYRKLDRIIPNGVKVVEHCCGSAQFYRWLLSKRDVDYLGHDVNPVFLRWASTMGIPVDSCDIVSGELPQGDWVLLQGSLYQFAPACRELLVRLQHSASTAVVVSEAVFNVGSHPSAVVRKIAHLATALNGRKVSFRFDRQKFRELAESFEDELLLYITGKREDIIVLKGLRV
ncbi:MAG: hypothetical protein NUW37_15125 [Planctomycetes bacterium]|nr:hypothetical protein [Planctomycetota bacterium]